MPIARITTPGLTAMAVSVILLWTCLITERVMVRNAARNETRVLREMNLLRHRQRAVPADAPAPQHRKRWRAVEG